MALTPSPKSVYSLNNPGGNIPFTGWSPSLGTGAANVAAAGGAVQFNGITQDDYKMFRHFSTQANKAFLAVLLKVIGVAPGAAVTASNVRVSHVQGAPGGLIPIENVSLVNRNTTANDVTAITAMLNRVVQPATYAPDLSGNGGGGKVAY